MRFERFFLLVPLFFLLAFYGCAGKPYRAHPEFEARSKSIKNPGLIPPDVRIYELSAGGVRELRDDWCVIGKDRVLSALTDCFAGKECKITCLSADDEIKEELEDIKALYRAISVSIRLHTYGPFLFPEKQNNFDYSIGSIEQLLEKLGADALIFVHGEDEISTGGRKALIVLGAIASGITGANVYVRGGITVVSVALVDASGTILWYNMRGSQGAHDLRDTASAAGLVQNILSTFPKMKQ